MELQEVREIARAWIAARGEHGEAWERLYHCCWKDPDAALRIIEEIHHHISSTAPVDYQLMATLAAGPLEDLLNEHGDKVIGQVERIAKDDREFRKCLTGV
jgi:hypothetical protein